MNGGLRAIIFRKSDDPDLYWAILRFRKALFVDHLGWVLNVSRGVETDQFDHEQATYCALMHSGQVLGCFRAIPCTKPYLARDVFSHLAPGAHFPTDSESWEISRFGVSPTSPVGGAHLYAAMMAFAEMRDIRVLPALVELHHERFLNRLGIRTRRYGRAVTIGETAHGRPIRCVVGEIPFREQRSILLDTFSDQIAQLEIIDEVANVGLDRIPA
ncbi:acyl-homoserine-lactone synthase [Tepidamorphus sp. 3E244]|uniref:acyl-homoserine-lactone synthase n=1 Tax=Tepidamorphus sp. 3E244 TaxID=3385498 RepID=UPI0038FC4899